MSGDFEAMPEVEAGGWGWCLYRGEDDALFLVWWDDDDAECVCGVEGCDQWVDYDEDGDRLAKRADPGHRAIDTAICYWHPDHFFDGKGYFTAYLSDLRQIPDGLVPHLPSESVLSGKDGWVYVVAIVPELTFDRVKVGFTSRHISERLRQFRTANPTAVLLGIWEADQSDEARIHTMIPGRVGRSEVFSCDARKVITTVHRELAHRDPAPP